MKDFSIYLLITFIGYSQNPIQPNHENLMMIQHLLERIKPFDSEFVNNDVIILTLFKGLVE